MTPEAATDEILGVFKAAWDGTGYAPPLWSGTVGGPPTAPAPWVRVGVQHADGRQTGFSVGGSSGRLYTHSGFVWVQLFVPEGQGRELALQLARLVLNAYRTARGSVWYRNHRFREAGSSGGYAQVNCNIDFAYDDQ